MTELDNKHAEVKTPEQPASDDKGVNKEIHNSHKAELDQNSAIGKPENTKKSIDERFNSIKERSEDFTDRYKHNDFHDKAEAEKALGANVTTERNIQEVRTDINKSKDELYGRWAELNNENPDYNAENNSEYKSLCDRINKLDSYEKSLSAYEGTLDGRNYDLSQEHNIPYLQQADKFRYHEDGAIGAVDDYVTALEKKIESGDTSKVDRFMTDFQESRVSDALSSYKEHGSLEERSKADKLTERFNSCKETLDAQYKDWKLNQDGTITEKSEKQFGLKFDKSSDSPLISEDGKSKKETESTSTVLGGNITKTSESLLYTGRDTGRSQVKLEAEVYKSDVKEKTTLYDDAGNIKLEQTKNAEFAVGKVNAEAHFDSKEKKMGVSAEATGVHSELTRIDKREDVTNTTKIESNIGHAKASAELDAKKLSAEASASAAVADIKTKFENDINGEKTSVEFEASALKVGAKAELSKYGIDASVSDKPAEIKLSLKENGVSVLEGKPLSDNSETGGVKPNADKIHSTIEQFSDLKREQNRSREAYADSKAKEGELTHKIESSAEKNEHISHKERGAVLDSEGTIGKKSTGNFEQSNSNVRDLNEKRSEVNERNPNIENRKGLSESDRGDLMSKLSDEHCKKAVDIVKSATIDGKEGGKHDDTGENFTNHTQEHLEQVIEKSNEVAKAVAEAVKAGKINIEHPSGDISFSSNIDYRVIDCAALSHDTGMSNHGYIKDSDGSIVKQNSLDFNQVRSNHSLNSAMRVLENRDLFKSNYGLSDEQVDKVALECFAHSKSKSGINNLNSSECWEKGVNTLNKLVDTYNSDQENEGKHISFNGAALLGDKEKLGPLASETLALRLGDVSRDSKPYAISQSGEPIHVNKENGYNESAGAYKEEAKSIEVTRNGEPVTNLKSIQVHAGEQNIVSNRTHFDSERGIVHEITIADGNFAPFCTYEAIMDHVGELGSAKDGKFNIDIVFQTEPSETTQSKYCDLKENSKYDRQNVKLNLNFDKEKNNRVEN